MLLALGFAKVGSAQEWIQFEDSIWGISINFPHEPVSERIDYATHLGETVPAQRYSAERNGATYELTLVFYSQTRTDAHTAISLAAELIRDKGEATYYAYDNLDGIPGQLMSIIQPDGRRIEAVLYFVDQRLYIAEGNVPPGAPPALQFVQSISILGPTGERIVLEPD